MQNEYDDLILTAFNEAFEAEFGMTPKELTEQYERDLLTNLSNMNEASDPNMMKLRDAARQKLSDDG